MREKKAPARKQQDFVHCRIEAIYAGLTASERAELLAAAERIADHDRQELSDSFPTSTELPETVEVERCKREYTVVKGKLLVEVTDEVTRTPRGKPAGNKFFHIQIRCPNRNCQALFYVPKMRLGRKTACPFCGQHVIVKS